MANHDEARPARRPRSKLLWILPAILIGAIVVFAINGIGRGLGEASGVDAAAPGDTNAERAPDTHDGNSKY